MTRTERLAAYVAWVRERVDAGVDYSPRHGARCPVCGARMPVTRTCPWEGNARLRYHRCRAEGCLVRAMGLAVKSVQEDQGGPPPGPAEPPVPPPEI